MSNIQFTAMIRFVFAPQGNFLTFGARPKYDVPRYHKTISLHTIRGIDMIALVEQNHLLTFRPRHNHDLPWWNNATFFVSNIGWFSSLGTTFVGSCTFGLPLVLVY
jgi:hypothetical protein